MADDVKLLAVIDANTKAFENALKRIERSTNATFGKADQSVRRLEKTLATTSTRLASVGRNFSTAFLRPLAALAGAAALGDAINAFQRIENALAVAGLRGEEAAKVFDHLSESAQHNGAPVEALAQLYSRLAIVQKELGVNSDEVLHFMDGVAAALRVSGRSAEESRGALLQLSQAMGSGIVRAEEFNAILEGMLPVAQAAARGLEEAGGSVAKLRTLIINGQVSSATFFKAFEAGQGVLQDLADTTDLTLGQAFENLRTRTILAIGELDKATGSSDRLKDALNAVGNAINFVTINLAAFARTDAGGAIGDMADEISNAGAKTRRLVEGFFAGKFKGEEGHEFVRHIIDTDEAILEAQDKLKDDLKGLKDNPIQVGDLIALPDKNADRAVAETEAIAKRVEEAFQNIGEGKKKVETVSLKDPGLQPPILPRLHGGKSQEERDAESAARAIEQERKAVVDLISDLEFENRLIGLSDVEREKEIALRHAGAAATQEQRDQIAALVTAGVSEQASLDALIDRMDEVRDAAGGALSSFVDSLREGKGLADSLQSALDSVLDAVIRIAEQKLIASLFGAPGTAGPLGSIFGSLAGGGGAAPILGGGGIGSSLALQSLPRQIGGTASRAAPGIINLHINGAVGNTEVREMAAAGTLEALTAYDKTLPSRVRGVVGKMARPRALAR